MLLVAAFNPISAMSGSFVANTLQVGSKIIVINKSYVDILFTFSNGNTVLVIANDRRGFTLNDVLAVGNPTITWKQQNIDYPQTVNQLENVCYVEVYQPNEVITETYPNTIVRETLPSLVPYNTGYGASQIGLTNGRNVSIFPSSYIGLAVAPPISISPINGLGFDHFYAYQNPSFATMQDLPGVYTSSTGKTGNNATPSNLAAMSSVPGPFSLTGLAPIDTGTKLQGAFWTLGSTIPWNSSTNGYLVECWFQVPNVATGASQFIFGDDDPFTNAKGLSCFLGSSGNLFFVAQFVGGTKVAIAPAGAIQPNTWYYIACQYTGTVDNHINLFVNGNLVATTVTSGAPVATTLAFCWGSNSVEQFPLVGQMAYMGMLLSGPGTGQGSPAARFKHGLQSLNVDYQNAWLSRVDFFVETLNANVPDGAKITIQNLYNYAGLLYATTPANTDALHIYNPQLVSSLLILPAQAIGQLTTYQFDYKTPLSHPNDIFITIVTTGFNNSDQRLFVNTQGFNMLGLA